MIIDTLRQRLNKARKEQNIFERDTLAMLIGEMTANAPLVQGEKIVTDEAVVAHMRKHRKKMQDAAAQMTSPEAILECTKEIMFVGEFIPPQLGEDDITKIVEGSDFPNLGAFMGYMKETYPGLYDGRLASDTWKRLKSA